MSICRRIYILTAFLLVVYAMLAVRLSFLHLGRTKEIRKPTPYQLELPARRGSIYDRHGASNPLAAVLPTRLFFVDPSLIPEEEHGSVAEVLGSMLSLDKGDMLGVLARRKRKYVPLAYISDDNLMEELRTHPLLKGRTGLQHATLRHYPLGRHLSHVLGYVNREQVGVAGIELACNGLLTGTPGRIEGDADAERREIMERRRLKIEPQHGANVELTIDQMVQYHVEKALDKAMEQHSASAAWAVVMDSRTGEILALGSRPDADPARPGNNLEVWRNRAIAANYEPGSVMKALTIGAALNEGLIRTNSIIECENGSWFYAGRPLRDKVRGPSDITTIIRKSSNIGTAKIALLLEARCLEAYLRLAGFGESTRCGLPGEEAGLLEPARSWPKIKITRVAIGQGVAVTAMQMAGLYGAIANDGQRMRPQIVRRVVAADGEILRDFTPAPVGAPLFKPRVARQLCEMLETVTQPGGTGTRAAIPGYRVAGKTGTAQMAVPGGYSQKDYIASFTGFLPADDPRLVIAVAVERPYPLTGGGVVAAPVFAEIGLQAASYLGILPAEPLRDVFAVEEFDNEVPEGLPEIFP